MPDLKQTIQQEATRLAILCDMPAKDICESHTIEPHASDANWHKMIIVRGQAETLLDLLAQAGMYEPNPKTRDPSVVLPDIAGKFIAIPAYKAAGRVQSVRWAKHGSHSAIEVVLKEHPDDPPQEWRTILLEPMEYEIIA